MVAGDQKEIRWVGSSFEDLLRFPASARRLAGFELGKIQAGLEPSDWKPLDVIGAGVREIRIRDATGAFRVLFVAKFEEAVYVLHCFRKQSQKTSEPDKFIAQTRYRAILKDRPSQP